MSGTKHKTTKQFNDILRGGDFDNNEHIPIQARPLEVKVYDSFDKAMRHFRTLVQKERVLSNFKEHQRYEKPSDKKRRKISENKRKRLELETKQSNNHQRKEKVRELKGPSEE